jgi:hypothetical protein
LKLDFTQGKDYNVTQVNSWFNNITTPSESDTNLKNEILSMLGSFEFNYGQYLWYVGYIFKHKDELTEKKKDEERKKNVLIYLLER